MHESASQLNSPDCRRPDSEKPGPAGELCWKVPRQTLDPDNCLSEKAGALPGASAWLHGHFNQCTVSASWNTSRRLSLAKASLRGPVQVPLEVSGLSVQCHCFRLKPFENTWPAHGACELSKILCFQWAETLCPGLRVCSWVSPSALLPLLPLP